VTAAAVCPICRERRAEPDHAPFCSVRCRDLDMGRWLSGAYRVPTDEPSPPQAAEQPDPPVNGSSGT
jgi:hypothetical protein